MKSRILIILAVFAAAVCINDIASAQGRGGFRGGIGRGGGGGWLNLLRMESVQSEIELVDDQLEEIEGLQEEMWQEMQESMRGLRDLPAEERREQFSAIRSKMEEKQKEYQKEIEEVLLPMQVKRLKELQVQSRARRSGNGSMGILQSDDMLEELGIDEDQKKKLEEKIKEVRAEIEKKIKKLRKEAEEEVLSVLTSEQRKMFKEKVGETFDFGSDREQGFRRGARGRESDRGRRGRRED